VQVAEEASDDAAAMASGDRAAYAEVLLEFIRQGVRNTSWQGVPMARYGPAQERIHRILDAASLSRGLTRRGLTAIVALGVPIAYVVAAARPQNVSPRAAPPADKSLTFEVVSIKRPAPPQPGAGRKGSSGGPTGPGTRDPGRIHYAGIQLKELVMNAYNLKDFQDHRARLAGRHR